MNNIAVYRSSGEVSKDIIELFAREKSVKFPISYVSMLSKYNWLRPQNDVFDFIEVTGLASDRDINFYGYDVENYPGSYTIAEAQDFDIYGYKNIIAIGFSGNGDYICFDYREDPTTNNPPVVLMYHDQYIKDEQGQPKMAVIKIADNFEIFIQMLHE